MSPRIASLISSATEILYLLGLGDQLVGVSHECDYPPEVVRKPRLTRSLVLADASSREIDEQVRSLASGEMALYEIDVERLAELAPDLIITQAQCDVCAVRYQDVVDAVRGTAALAGAEILPLNPTSIHDVFEDIARVGTAAGVVDRAANVRASLESRYRGVVTRGVQVPEARRWRTACLEWIDPPMVAANWTPELIEAAGARSDLATPGQHTAYADWSQIIDYDPEAIVIMPCGFDLARAIAESRALAGLPGWNDLAAVRAGRMFAVDGNAYFNRSGPRLVDSAEILGHLFHPELFEAPRVPQPAWQRMIVHLGELLPEAR
jgi:iron complex transport system substrate-binding protein